MSEHTPPWLVQASRGVVRAIGQIISPPETWADVDLIPKSGSWDMTVTFKDGSKRTVSIEESEVDAVLVWLANFGGPQIGRFPPEATGTS